MRRTRVPVLVIPIIALSLAAGACGGGSAAKSANPGGAAGTSGTGTAAAAVEAAWPHPFPCRVGDPAAPDLFVMTLGPVDTPLAQGVFDPAADAVRMKDGTVKADYFRKTLGLKYYAPLDKSVFPLPPSGLCTWYYYYQDVSEDEVKANSLWLAHNLKEFGAEWVQIDDGWQAETAEGRHGSRDWTGVDKAFPAGMASLAAYIKSVGLRPGIWIAPHGQSNEAAVKGLPGVFILKPDGKSASETWEGKYLVDPSPAGRAYLKDLFRKLAGWGYEYFKIDGQPIVVEEYDRLKPRMKDPGEGDGAELYRKTLAPIREAIGPKSYLLGCWGTPVEGIGIMNGSRTGGDIVPGWSGFKVALEATMQWYFTHNIAWYADPDVVLVRPPLTMDQARVWATLQGLTGQALMSSDRLTDLSAERVELLRRIFPAVDIRPFDLFPAGRSKTVWDLKISHLGRRYDVAGIFNFDEEKARSVRLDWNGLGLDSAKPVHVFDFWDGEYLGAWEAGMAFKLPPTSCRVLTLLPDDGGIELISTSRHITQGWVDLEKLERSADGASIKGRSRVIAGDPYELRFVFPRGKNFRIKDIAVSGGVPAKAENHQGWAVARLAPDKSAQLDWNVTFEPAGSYVYPTREPSGLRAKADGLDGVELGWEAQYYLNAAYSVLVDGKLAGYTPDTRFPLAGLDPFRKYKVEVRSVWMDGSVGPRHRKSEIEFTPVSLLPDSMALAALKPVRESGWSVFGDRLTVGGKKPVDAVVTGTEGLEYAVRGVYGTFTAQVGLPDRMPGETAAEFVLSGDGRVLWKSGPMRKGSGPRTLSVPVKGVQVLSLRVERTGDKEAAGERRSFGPFGVWSAARLSGPGGR